MAPKPKVLKAAATTSKVSKAVAPITKVSKAAAPKAAPAAAAVNPAASLALINTIVADKKAEITNNGRIDTATTNLMYFQTYTSDGSTIVQPPQTFIDMMPELPILPGGIITGVKGPITLSDMREKSFMTLFKILDTLYAEFQKVGNNPITSFIQIAANNIYRVNGVTYNYNELVKNYGKNRKELTDENVKDSDIAMIKILVALYTKLNDPIVSDAHKLLIRQGISCFELCLNAKEVLDLGALYAILDTVITDNNNNNHGHDAIIDRVNALIDPDLDALAAAQDYAAFNAATLAKNAVLETADGAAARLAARMFTVLTEASLQTGVSQSFVITGKDLFYISFLLTGDEPLVIDDPDLDSLPNIANIRRVVGLLIALNAKPYDQITLIDRQQVVDLTYYLLSNHQLMSELKTNDALIGRNYYDNMLPKWMCDSINVSNFLRLSNTNTIPEIKTKLISYNWDSQCHDNKDCRYFRILCVFFFLKKIQGSLDYNLFDDMFDLNLQMYSPGSPNPNPVEYTKRIAEAKANFYKLFSDLSLINFDIMLDSFAANNDKEAKKILFFLLSCKSYDAIEAALYKLLSRKVCYLFLEKPEEGNSNKNMFIFINSTGPAEQVRDTIDTNSRVVDPVIFLWLSKIAIDLAIHYSTSLYNLYGNTRETSQNLITAETMLDAASARVAKNTLYITDGGVGSTTDRIQMPLLQSNFEYTGADGVVGQCTIGFTYYSPNLSTDKQTSSFVPTNIKDNRGRSSLDTYLKKLLEFTTPTRKKDLAKICDRFIKIYDGHLAQFTVIDPVANWTYIPFTGQDADSTNRTIRNVIVKNGNDNADAKLRPLSQLIFFFRPLYTVAVKYMKNSPNYPTMTSLDLEPTVFPKLVSELTIFFQKDTTVVPQTILSVPQSSIKFTEYMNFLDLLVKPWINLAAPSPVDGEIDMTLYVGGAHTKFRNTRKNSFGGPIITTPLLQQEANRKLLKALAVSEAYNNANIQYIPLNLIAGRYGFDLQIGPDGGFLIKPLNDENEYKTYLRDNFGIVHVEPNSKRSKTMSYALQTPLKGTAKGPQIQPIGTPTSIAGPLSPMINDSWHGPKDPFLTASISKFNKLPRSFSIPPPSMKQQPMNNPPSFASFDPNLSFPQSSSRPDLKRSRSVLANGGTKKNKHQRKRSIKKRRNKNNKRSLKRLKRNTKKRRDRS